MAPQGPQHKNWTFTVFFQDEAVEKDWFKKLEDIVDYACYGRELCPETKREHFQGYIQFKNRKRMSALKVLHPTAHWEIARGTDQSNYDYCSKDGVFTEIGTRIPVAAAAGKERYKRSRELAEAGDFDAIDDDIYIRCYSSLRCIHKDKRRKLPDLEAPCGLWIWGSSGSGKSKMAREIGAESMYFKMPDKWWDGYCDEDTVIIDDLDQTHVSMAYWLKIFADRYAFPVHVKNGGLFIRPKRIIVTSQYPIEEIWTDDETVSALRRRFEVKHLGGLKSTGNGTVDTFIQLTAN